MSKQNNFMSRVDYFNNIIINISSKLSAMKQHETSHEYFPYNIVGSHKLQHDIQLNLSSRLKVTGLGVVCTEAGTYRHG